MEKNSLYLMRQKSNKLSAIQDKLNILQEYQKDRNQFRNKNILQRFNFLLYFS